MSYSRHSLGEVSVGAAASRDVILANASLVASKIILQATRKPPAIRAEFIANKLNAMKPGLASEVARDAARLIVSKGHDQGMFDAMRLGIANVEMDRGLASLTSRLAAIHRGEAEALGDDRTTGCAIASTASTVGGVASVIPGYGTLIGAVVGIGSGIAGQALDCGRETRQAAQTAAQAQANMEAAQAAAMQQQQMLAQQQRQQALTRIAVIGGGAVLVVGLIYWVL